MTSFLHLRVYLFFTITLTLIFFQITLKNLHAGEEPEGRAVSVKYVIDGDTIVINSGEHLRYIGMDTPERGEDFFKEARDVNKSLLKAGRVEVVECRGEKKDKYGRTLVWVYAGGKLVNAELLSRGLARPLIIPPCGLEKRALLERLAWQARSSAKGIWRAEGGEDKALVVAPGEAERHIGEFVRVKGTVRDIKHRGRVVFVEFGAGDAANFKAVIFKDARKSFKNAGIEPSSFAGHELSITGVVRRYKGRAEVILVDPRQVHLYREP